ncbi:MAG: TldD/PmbA family protein [Thermoplasmata archaeon]
MTTHLSPNPVAFRVADRLHAPTPWEVFGQRARRFEVHFNGPTVEYLRGPLLVEGYGIRVFRPHDEKTGAGFHASTDATDAGISQSLAEAETVAGHSMFPAKRIDLPSAPAPTSGPEILDAQLWDSPTDRIQAYMAALVAPFQSLKDVVPSFGSVRATLSEVSIANSAGLRAQYASTMMELEIAVKAFGGPEGAPPGEYWVNNAERRADPTHAGRDVSKWVQYAQDARRAKAPPTGDLSVVLPAEATASILPDVIGFRFSGASRLREIAPAEGSTVAAPAVTIRDDAHFPWGPSSSPFDDEGSRTGSRHLVRSGSAADLLYDLRHAGAFGVPSTGNGQRGLSFGRRDWMRFSHDAGTGPTTIVLEPGEGGSDNEIAEAAGDGIWVQQLGWASPDPLSGAFGGEVRIGYRIRHGKIAEPIRGGTVGGVVLGTAGTPTLLTSIAALGSTATLTENFSGPTILVKPLTVAGA